MSDLRTVDKGRFPIVTRKNGNLKFHPETIKNILSKTKKFHQHKLIPVAFFCPTFTKPEVLSNVLLHYFRFQKEWLVDEKLYTEIEKDSYFKFSGNDATGIYTYPGLFSINQQGLNILLHVHYNQLDPRRDKDQLENLLLLFSSRIIEINLSELKFSVFESANNILTSNLAQKDLCRDLAFVTRAHQEDTLPPNEEKYNLDGFRKINFIFVKMEWGSFGNNLNQKIMPPEMKMFLENIVIEMFSSEISLDTTPPNLGDLLIYFKKCFDSLSQTASKKHTEGIASVVQSRNGNHVLEEIANALFKPMRNQILEGIHSGSGDIYKLLVSGTYEVDQNKILRRYHPIIRALQLNTISIQVFQKIINDKFLVESAQLKMLVKVLKEVHHELVESVIEQGKLAKNIVEGMPNQVLNGESYSPFIQKIVRMLPRFFKHKRNCRLIMSCAMCRKCILVTKLRYDNLLQVALSERKFSRETFMAIHVEILKKYMAAIEIAIDLLPKKMDSVVFEIYNKEDHFHEEFLTIREYNLENLESSCKTIKHFVKGIKGQYDLQMQKDLKSNTAMTSEDLEDIHQSALSEAEKNFEGTIKTSEYSTEDFNEHVKTLRYRVNQAFEGYKVRHARFVSTPAPPDNHVAETLNAPVSLLIAIDEPSIPAPELKQALLLIQFTLNKLNCKVIFDGGTEDIFEFKFSVELAVALLEDGRLLFGENYEDFSRSIVTFPEKAKVFKIRDCFFSNFGEWSEIVGNSRRKINEVFLLGLIFADLETKIKLKCKASIEKVVVTTPEWLSTVNKSKIRAAFSVAGFVNVDFIPETFAVTCSTLSSGADNKSPGPNILVLSENSDVVEIGIFSVKNSTEFHSEFYESFYSSEREKVESWLETGLGNIFSKIQRIRVASNYENLEWKTIFEKVIPPGQRSSIVFGDVFEGSMNFYKDENTKLSHSRDSNKMILFRELENGTLKEADIEYENNEKVFVSRMKQMHIVKYYEERTTGIFLLGTLMLHKPNSSRELISYFKVENSDLKLIRVENTMTPATEPEICNKSSSVNSEGFHFYPAMGVVSEEMGDFIRELVQEKYQNLIGNAKDQLKVKCVFLKSSYEKGEIKFKSTLAQKLFLQEIDTVEKLIRNRNPSFDEIKMRVGVLHKYETKYLTNIK